MGFCEFKNAFGEPNKISHSYRIPIVNLAFVDVVLTIAIGYAISHYFEYYFITIIIILILLSIISHRIFCVRTTVDKFLFT